MPRNRGFGESAEPSDKPADPKTTGPAGATEKQVAFISRLFDEKDLAKDPRFWDATNAMDVGELAQYIAHLNESVKSVSRQRASQIIEALMALPNKERTFAPLPDVPAGRYAVKDNEGEWSFYKVDRPEQGKWAGRTFVKRLVASGGFGDDLDEQKLEFKVQVTILERIVDMGIEKSMAEYGHQLGVCGACGRTLTDEVSIERGIGPVCAARLGF